MANGKTKTPEREFEIGRDEQWSANLKLVFDEVLKHLAGLSGTSLESVKRNRSIVDKLLSDAQQYDNARQATANVALNYLVETGNMVGKQAVRHSDIAIDRQWNLDEVANAAAVVATVLAKMGIKFDKS